MTREKLPKSIIVEYGNVSKEGVSLKLNQATRLKDGNMSCNEFWVSWDKIGKALFENYCDAPEVADRRELREESLSLPPADATAEEIDDKPCNKCTYNGHTTICEQCNDGNDYEHFTYNDPYSKESMNFFKVFIKARKELCSQSPTETYSLEEAIRKAFDAAQRQPQPTAEGAEAFWQEKEKGMIKSIGLESMKSDKLYLPNEMWQFAEEFATLTADKIVNERTPKIINDFLDFALPIYWGENEYTNFEQIAKLYLKTRSHE